jgi:hypothetical protein
VLTNKAILFRISALKAFIKAGLNQIFKKNLKHQRDFQKKAEKILDFFFNLLAQLEVA